MKVPFVDVKSVTMTFPSTKSIMACAPLTVGTPIGKFTASDFCLPITLFAAEISKSPGGGTGASKCAMDMSPQFLSTYFDPAAPFPSSLAARARVELAARVPRRPRTTGGFTTGGLTTAVLDIDVDIDVAVSPSALCFFQTRDRSIDRSIQSNPIRPTNRSIINQSEPQSKGIDPRVATARARRRRGVDGVSSDRAREHRPTTDATRPSSVVCRRPVRGARLQNPGG
jgi:hypothetical protein